MNQADEEARGIAARAVYKGIRNLKWGESYTIQDVGLLVVAVPGGHLYMSFNPNSETMDTEAMCFVPWQEV